MPVHYQLSSKDVILYFLLLPPVEDYEMKLLGGTSQIKIDVIMNDFESSMKNLKKSEMNVVKKMKTNLRKIFDQNEEAINSKFKRLEALLSGLSRKNVKIQLQLSELKNYSAKLGSENAKLKGNFGLLQENSIPKETHKRCLIGLSEEKRKYESLSPKVSKLKNIIEFIKDTELFKLIQTYKSYKNLYNLKLSNEKSLQITIQREKIKVSRLSKNLKQLSLECKAFRNVKENLDKSLSLNAKLKSEADECYTQRLLCASQNRHQKKTIRSLGNFFSYLLERLGEVQAGVRHFQAARQQCQSSAQGCIPWYSTGSQWT